MPKMLSPDGKEIFEVPAAMVEHYKAKGAIMSQGAEAEMSAPQPNPLAEMGLGLLGTGGAIPGALTGARMGASLGPWGVLGGGLIGGVAGGLTGEAVAQGARAPLGLEQQTRDESIINYLKQGAWGGVAGLLGPGRAIPAGWAAAKELLPALQRVGKARTAAAAAIGGGKAASATPAAKGIETAAEAVTGTAKKAAGRVVSAIKPSSTKMPKLPPSQATKGVDPTVPIKVAGKPKAVRLAKQRGVSKRELASRQEGMAGGDDMAAQLQKSLDFEKELARRGFTPQQKQALRRSAMEYLQGGAQ